MGDCGIAVVRVRTGVKGRKGDGRVGVLVAATRREPFVWDEGMRSLVMTATAAPRHDCKRKTPFASQGDGTEVQRYVSSSG